MMYMPTVSTVSIDTASQLAARNILCWEKP
jgi:hypothetical protein